MGKGRNILEHMLDQGAMHPESVPGLPIVEIAGERRVLIENHRGVAAYGRERILVNVKYGTVCVCGCNLELIRMTREQLIILGRIDSVSLQRRRCV